MRVFVGLAIALLLASGMGIGYRAINAHSHAERGSARALGAIKKLKYKFDEDATTETKKLTFKISDFATTASPGDTYTVELYVDTTSGAISASTEADISVSGTFVAKNDKVLELDSFEDGKALFIPAKGLLKFNKTVFKKRFLMGDTIPFNSPDAVVGRPHVLRITITRSGISQVIDYDFNATSKRKEKEGEFRDIRQVVKVKVRGRLIK